MIIDDETPLFTTIVINQTTKTHSNTNQLNPKPPTQFTNN
jgi:hypothetical protein